MCFMRHFFRSGSGGSGRARRLVCRGSRIVVVGACLGMGAFAHAVGPNLILNPGFEEGASTACTVVPKHWESADCDGAVQQITGQTKHSGSWAMRLGSGSVDHGMVRQVSAYNSVQAGKTYVVSAWIKCQVVPLWGWNVFRVEPYFNDTALFHINMPQQESTNYDWREITWEVNVPADSSINRVAAVLTRHWDTGTVWYDDISIAEKTSGPAQIGRSPSSFTRTLLLDQPIPTDVFTVQNMGDQPLNYTIAADVNWLGINPSSGSSTGEADSIDLQYLAAHLAVGLQQGQITISSTEATNSPQTIAVSVTGMLSADFDEDMDIDQEDFGHLQTCLTGDGMAQLEPACLDARLDADTDVDVADIVKFLACYSGSNILPAQGCWE